MLEAGIYADNAFVTLTYDPKRFPDESYSLRPGDLQNFMKALRKKIYPLKVRFYGVGEYGEKSEHAHFHLALFGYPSCKRTRPHRGLACKCDPCTVLRQAWTKGFILNGDLEIASARYIARYVVKKMTRRDDVRLHNREPEFARMSLRPGVGHGILDQVAAVIARYKLFTPEGDVPVTLRHGATEYPLGRYLRKQLRKKLGLNEKAPQAVLDKYNEEMLPLRMAARSDNENPSFKAHLLEASRGKMEQVLARHKTFKRKGTL